MGQTVVEAAAGVVVRMTYPGGDWLGYWMAMFFVAYTVTGAIMAAAIYTMDTLARRACKQGIATRISR